MKKLIVIFAFFTLWSCRSDPKQAQSEEMTSQEETEPQGLRLTKFSASAPFGDASLTNMRYENGKFSYDVGGNSYKLGQQTGDAPRKMCANSAKGQHIHLILNNEPYTAHYTREFDRAIEDGEYHLLSFLSRSYHESIKFPAASIARKITVKDGGIENEEGIEGPMLFYSRPKGSYTGKAETDKVMLDFYCVNFKPGAYYRIAVDIDSGALMDTLHDWKPVYIEGLGMGEHSISLSLIDPDGKLVEAPYNPVTRTINLVADPLED